MLDDIERARQAHLQQLAALACAGPRMTDARAGETRSGGLVVAPPARPDTAAPAGAGLPLFSLFVLYPIAQSVRCRSTTGMESARRSGSGLAISPSSPPIRCSHRARQQSAVARAAISRRRCSGCARAVSQPGDRGIRLVRALFFLPFVISQVVVGLIFAWFSQRAISACSTGCSTLLGIAPVAPLDSERGRSSP